MHEDAIDLAEVVDRAALALGEHRRHGVMGRVDVAARRVAAVEHREVLHLAVVARRLAEPREGLAEVHRAVVGVAPARGEIHLEKPRVAVDEHRHGAGALRRLPRAPERVLRDVGGDDDRLPARAVRGEVAQRGLEPIDTRKAGVLELGHLAVAGQERHALRGERVVDHALDDDGARRIVAARLGAEGEHADPLRVELVVLDEAQHGVRGERVDALGGPAHPEAAPDDAPRLLPGLVVPGTPVLQRDAVRGQIQRQSADSREHAVPSFGGPLGHTLDFSKRR